MRYSKQLSIVLAGLLASSGVLASPSATNTGYLELGAGGGLIGNAFESKYIHKNDGWGPAFNARIGGGVLLNSDHSSRFIGLSGHVNAYEYLDANIAFGRHLNDTTDYSFIIGADFSDRFIVPRMGFDVNCQVARHLSVGAEVAFDAFIAPSAWLTTRYTF